MGFKLETAFATDKRVEQEGKKLVLAPAKEGQGESYLMIARKTNPNYKEYISQVLQENQHTLQTRTPEAEELAQSIFRDAAAKHLLIGWGGIDWKDATDVPYSRDTAREMLNMSDFYKLVDDFASDMANFRKAQIEAEAKN